MPEPTAVLHSSGHCYCNDIIWRENVPVTMFLQQIGSLMQCAGAPRRLISALIDINEPLRCNVTAGEGRGLFQRVGVLRVTGTKVRMAMVSVCSEQALGHGG